MLGRPTAFIRKEINTYGKIRKENVDYLKFIVDKNEKKFVKKDIQRERRLEHKRAKRMEQLQYKLDMKDEHRVQELHKSK